MTASPKGHGEPGGQEKDREAGKKKRRDTKVIKARPEGSKVQGQGGPPHGHPLRNKTHSTASGTIPAAPFPAEAERGQETGDPEPEGTVLERTMLRLGKEQQELYRKLWNVFYFRI